MSITTEYFQILILKSNKILKKSEKNKKRTRKSFTKGREDGNINGHSTRETSERTLKTEQERIKHNVNESLEINRKQKRAKQTKVV